MSSLIKNYQSDSLASFRNYKHLAERAIEQVPDDEFFETIDAESNSIAILVKHIAGNLNSRWRDFLTSDGEKADRRRDTEFALIDDTRASLMQFWEDGWGTLFDSVEALNEEDFGKTVTIRGEKHTLIEAINRQLTHYSYHVGQIVFLAKHFKSRDWKNLSVPRNRSAEFNQFLAEKQSGGEPSSTRFDAPQEFTSGISEK